MAESAISVVIDDETETVHVDPVTGTVVTDQPDGGKIVNLDAKRPKADDDDEDFYDNLAADIDDMQLGKIANQLIDEIEADDRSRQGYLSTRARALDLLGLELKEPKSGTTDASGAVEGLSSVTNPLLLEAILKGWANTVGELLPADGPVKIRDEGDESTQEDDLAEALERDMNHYLTRIATEYYPDTSHMILWGPYFGGSGFKKIYRCPMRRRPVSESVDAKDLIVSDTTKDLRSCARITHQIAMRPSVMKRMQLIGAYRDAALTQPAPTSNQVDEKIAGIQGTSSLPSRPEDQPYTIYETQCELDLPDYAPGKFKDEGIPLPYLVTIDKDSREILSLRRDWKEEDEDATRLRMYVKYPYVPGPGFYGTGMLNILGNCSAAMTAVWREALDAGMFANFPGGLVAKSGARQNTSTIRVGLGEFAPIEVPSGVDIRSVVMGMPYKDVTPGLMALMDKILAQAKPLGGAADIPAAEGIANVPVGTMLAQIEQATKVMGAAHKGMHQAQSEEFELIEELFRDEPEDFWRGNDVAPDGFWNEEKFLRALDTVQLVPVSDPNVPSHLHRVMKALALLQLLPLFPMELDRDSVLLRCLHAIKEDPTGLVIPKEMRQQMPQGPGADPANMVKAQASMLSAQANQTKAQTSAQEAQAKAALEPQKIQTQRDIATSELAREMIIHGADEAKVAREHALEAGQQGTQLAQAHAAHGLAVTEHLHAREESDKEHGLALAQHLEDQQQSQRDHGLAVAEHLHEREESAREHEVAMEEAKHPPKPASAKKSK